MHFKKHSSRYIDPSPTFAVNQNYLRGFWRIAIRSAVRARSKRRETLILEDTIAAPTASDPVVAREDQRRIEAAFESLSAEQRVVIALFAIDDLSHKEIAELLGVPEGTVWSRLHIARKKLAAELSKEPSQK